MPRQYLGFRCNPWQTVEEERPGGRTGLAIPDRHSDKALLVQWERVMPGITKVFPFVEHVCEVRGGAWALLYTYIILEYSTFNYN